jgi:ATP-dependent DNA helicase RecG
MFEKSRDGFEVAEHDLQIRGPGEFLGTRQSGALRFRMGNILRDYDLMEKARDLATATVNESLPRAEEIAHRLLGVPLTAAAAKD